MDATTATAQAGARLRHQARLDVLTWPALDAYPVDAVVTTRGGGVSAPPYSSLNLGLHVGDAASAVQENRRRAAAAAGAGPEQVVWAAQPHGTGAQIVTAADRGRGAGQLEDAVPGVDVLVTADPGTVLAIIVADCVPIVLYDPVAHVLAGVHAGWRGTLARVTDAALTAMRSLGSQPADVLAGVGPGIAADRYQVGPEVAAAARACFGGDTSGILRPDGPDRWLLDLPAASHRILQEAGLLPANIHLAAERTGARPDGTAGLFFSYRDQCPTGRFAALARLRPRSAG